mmetsp:Transcript_1610/g.5524  ORF Transcript_1610/g.5524 Transcript_1610/m.5524 type:complete len:227 (+) Transcript_1610:6893-7573(+)
MLRLWELVQHNVQSWVVVVGPSVGVLLWLHDGELPRDSLVSKISLVLATKEANNSVVLLKVLLILRNLGPFLVLLMAHNGQSGKHHHHEACNDPYGSSNHNWPPPIEHIINSESEEHPERCKRNYKANEEGSQCKVRCNCSSEPLSLLSSAFQSVALKLCWASLHHVVDLLNQGNKFLFLHAVFQGVWHVLVKVTPVALQFVGEGFISVHFSVWWECSLGGRSNIC